MTNAIALRVGFIGLGLMGRPMALRILRAGYPLIVYNRTAAKADGLVSEGARRATTPADVGRESRLVITMVTGPKELEAMLFGPHGVTAGAAPGTTIIDMSTIGMEAAQKIAARLAQQQLRFLDAPVTGSVWGAEQGTLTMMVGGDAALLAEYRHLLETMGTPHHLGGIGMGSLMKLAQNLIAAAIVESLAEGMAMVQRHGLDPARAADLLAQTGVASTFLKVKAAQMVARDYAPRFSLSNMQKDLQLVLREAKRGRLPLPTAKTLAKVYRRAMRRGMADRDYAVLYDYFGGKSLAPKREAV